MIFFSYVSFRHGPAELVFRAAFRGSTKHDVFLMFRFVGTHSKFGYSSSVFAAGRTLVFHCASTYALVQSY